MNSTIKSTIDCLLIALRDKYLISNSLNSTVHYTILFAMSCLFNMFMSEVSVRILKVCAKKYSHNFFTNTTNANANYSRSK